MPGQKHSRFSRTAKVLRFVNIYFPWWPIFINFADANFHVWPSFKNFLGIHFSVDYFTRYWNLKKRKWLCKVRKDMIFVLLFFLSFSFNFETKNKILAEIHNLNNKKACQESDIPAKLIKDNIDIFLNLFFITSIIRYLMRRSPQNWKTQM